MSWNLWLAKLRTIFCPYTYGNPCKRQRNTKISKESPGFQISKELNLNKKTGKEGQGSIVNVEISSQALCWESLNRRRPAGMSTPDMRILGSQRSCNLSKAICTHLESVVVALDLSAPKLWKRNGSHIGIARAKSPDRISAER